MINFLDTATEFVQIVADGYGLFFEKFFTYTVRDFLLDAISFDPSNYLTFVPQTFWEMALPFAVFGVGIFVVMAYNFLKWAFGIITGS